MKKFYLVIVLALSAIFCSAQDSLYSVSTTVTNDASWGNAWADYFVFKGTEVKVEVFEEDYIIVRNWAGVEGCDLKVEFDSSIDTEDENCLGNVISVSTIYYGDEVDPDFRDCGNGKQCCYFYTERGDDYSVFADSTNDDGTLYYCFVSVDREAKTGSLYLAGKYAAADKDDATWSDYCYYYFIEWPYVPKEADPVFYGTYKAYVAEDEVEEGDYFSTALLKGYSVMVDVYDQYVIIHDYSNTPDKPRDLKIGYDQSDSYAATSLVHTLVSSGKETDLTGGGYLYTGLSSVDGADYLAAIYLYSCADGYNYTWWDETSGYIKLNGVGYSKDADGNYLDDYEYGYYYVYWNGAQKLYSVEGEFVSQEDSQSGFLHVGEKAKVDVYDNRTIIVRDFAGNEGYDLKVNFAADQSVVSLAELIYDDECYGVTAEDASWFYFELPENQYLYIWGWNNYSWANANEDETGYIYLYVSSATNSYGDYIYITWPTDDETAVSSVAQEVYAPSILYNLAGEKVSSDYKGIVIKNGKKFFQNKK